MVELVLGALLVLVTWALAALVIVLLGLLPGSIGAADRPQALRRALWWGLAIAVALVLAISLLMPLGSATGLAIVLGAAVVLGAIGLRHVRYLPLARRAVSLGLGEWAIVAVLVLSLLYLAVAALGPVTNYDSGLYHLGAVRYQQEFGLVPGIANLFFPLGYGNSVIPMSAFLGSTPWGPDGYRLFNGLLLCILAADTVLRLLGRRLSPGTFLLIGALLFVWIPMVALSDYWVTSPTSDSSVLVVTTVAVAYLADALSGRPRSTVPWMDASVSLMASWILVSMRPTMAVFAAGVVAVLAFAAFRRRRVSARDTQSRRLLVIGAAVMGLVIFALQAARDRVLSGWLQYPLSVFAFDVPWRAADPVGFRTATLGAARDPRDLWAAAEGWAWISGWAARLPSQWEFGLFVLLSALSVALLIWSARAGVRVHVRVVLLACAPSALAVLAWFVASPPSFRFIWGPLFTLAALPGAFAARALRGGSRPTGAAHLAAHVIMAACGAAVLGIVAFSAVARLDTTRVESRVLAIGPLTVSYRVSPLTSPTTTSSLLPSGLIVVSPVESDQCWGVYPMCTAQIEPTVTLIGSSIMEGFRR